MGVTHCHSRQGDTAENTPCCRFASLVISQTGEFLSCDVIPALIPGSSAKPIPAQEGSCVSSKVSSRAPGTCSGVRETGATCLSRLWGFAGRVGYEGDIFVPGGIAVKRESVSISVPWSSAGPLGVKVHSYSQLTEGKEPKEGLEQSWGSGQDREEHEGA